MIAALDIALRASLVVLAALVAASALRRRSAALRHWILAVGIFAGAIVVPLGRALPPWDVAFQPPNPIDFAIATLVTPAPLQGLDPVTTGAARTQAVELAGGMPLALILNTLWALGTAVATMLTVLSLVRLARLTRTSTAVTDRRWNEPIEDLRQILNVPQHVEVLRSDQPGLIGTYGWRRPRVLLPPDCDSWSDDRIRIVLGHELAHVRRADWIIQVAAQTVRAVFWYNPLFWMACARLRSESEQAADDAVLEAGVSPPEYAAHLLEIARACRPLGGDAVVPMARRSTLEGRIAAMLNTTLAHQRPTRRALTTALVVIAGITVAAASFRGSDQTQPRPLTGTVYDMTGAVLPQVALTLQDAAGLQQSATTDRDGRFDFGVIAPGRYRLSLTLIGFHPVAQEMTLQEARHWDRTITLQVGTLQETITVIDRRPAGAPPRATMPAPIGGNIRTPRKTVDIRPVYPEALRAGGIEGVVPLGAVIGADGNVVSVRVLSSHAHADLAKSAVDAVRQWRFTPTLLNSEAIEVYMTVTVRFSLED